MGLSELESARTARQQVLIGQDAQVALNRAHVLIVGAGGLGCPVLQQLAAAGIGHITLIDDDEVALSNIHRQVLFGVDDVGQPKAAVAARRARKLQPEIHIQAKVARFSADNALQLCQDTDLVIDGTDTFDTKYLIADACEATSTPLVWGTVLGFRGDVALWHSGTDTPDGRGCGLRDLFPATPTAAPNADALPDCASAGVLGATTSVIGGLMATAAIGWFTGIDTTVGQVSSYTAYPASLRSFRVSADPGRALCTSLEAHAELDSAASVAASAGVAAECFLDIRDPSALLYSSLPANLRQRALPFHKIAAGTAGDEMVRAALSSLDAPAGGTVWVICDSGSRSAGFALRYGELAAGLGLRLRSYPGGAERLRRELG